MAKIVNINFSEFNKLVLTQHNIIRQDPTSYIPLLQAQMKNFKGDIIFKPREVPIQTQEGLAAFEEAIKFLQTVKPIDALTYDKNLSSAAHEHVKDIGPKGLVTHESSDGKTMSDRVELFSEWDGCCGENIDIGSKTAQDVIISLLVDDGVPDRGHRRNMFTKEFKFVGIASGNHSEYGIVTVINYVGGLRELGKPFYDYKNYKYKYPEEVQKSFFMKKSPEEKKIKSPFQVNDDDAPDGTVSVKISKKRKNYDGKNLTITKKYYYLEDGTQQIVEIEEF